MIVLNADVIKDNPPLKGKGILNEVAVFDQHQASHAASLRKATKSFGLSLGDRACLALSQIKKVPP